MAARDPLPSNGSSALNDAVEAFVFGAFRLAREEAALAGLSPPQFRMMRWIARGGTLPTTGWAGPSGLRASTVSGLVDGLVRRGWVERGPDPSDRRKVLLRLTSEGRALVTRVETARRRRMGRAFAALAPGERATATRLLRRLTERLPPAPRPSAGPKGRGRGVPP
jgi:DNA-binding MarR family transcriptional regulator